MPVLKISLTFFRWRMMLRLNWSSRSNSSWLMKYSDPEQSPWNRSQGLEQVRRRVRPKRLSQHPGLSSGPAKNQLGPSKETARNQQGQVQQRHYNREGLTQPDQTLFQLLTRDQQPYHPSKSHNSSMFRFKICGFIWLISKHQSQRKHENCEIIYLIIIP